MHVHWSPKSSHTVYTWSKVNWRLASHGVHLDICFLLGTALDNYITFYVGGSVVSAANSIPSQYIYRVSPPHEMARKANRSRKQSPNAVAPAESDQLKRDKSTRSNKSTDSERSRKREDREKAKLEELRLKAEAWETAKNAAILNR